MTIILNKTNKITQFKTKLNKQQIYIIIFNIIWLLGLYYKVHYFQFSGNINKVGESIRNLYMVLATLTSLLIIYSVIQIVFFKIQKGVLLFIYITLSLLIIGDTLYSRYYYSPLNISLIHLSGAVGNVNNSIKSLFKIKDILLIIDLPIIIWLYFKVRKHKFKLSYKYFYLMQCILLLIGIFGFKKAYQHADIKSFIWQKKYAARDLGVLYYHYYDINKYVKTIINKNKKITNEEKELIKSQLYVQKKDQYTGLAKGKNLIVLQLEAFQDFVMEKSIDDREITPNLNKLIKESYYFNNVYHQVGMGNTSDAEFIANNSLHPTKSSPVYYDYANNNYYALPKVLKEAGYNTYAGHAFEPSFWNRTNMYKALGFDKFYSISDYKMTEKVGWALGDKQFFKQSLDMILEDTRDKPFYSFLVSLSSHHPYEGFNKDTSFNVGKYEGKQLGNFIKGAHYVDQAVGNLITYLKEKNIYENTMIVIYGDHSALFKDQEKDLYDFVKEEKNDFNWAKLQQVPVIIHIPNTKGKRSTRVAGQMDILPTVANLLDVKIPYMLGNNLLSDEKRTLVHRYGMVVTDEFMYLPDQDKVYNFKTKKITDKKEYEEFIEQKYKQLQASDLLIERNSIRKLKINKK